ncbi:hypothetical protein KDH_79550 [Dictyobacter sp. S3.2.2.5]|uniref:OmpR/PhoB-type domain-containing protein n=1 Tax=Dictyobacter halimunensis TaxID=3026934 RepID=A0ABQ6G3L7_9CHLR|nr:hypothetical protein KDH_79550 [Dictyobacter sp. S3.2.2.5]
MNAVAPVPLIQDHRRYRNYQVHDVLPASCLLTCDDHIRTMTLLCPNCDGFVCITEQQSFTDVEYALLHLLLQSYPDYCPYADLLACQSGEPLDQCQWVMNRALDQGDIKEVLKPVRCHLSRMRGKLRPFGLDVVSELTCGYVLIAAQH